MGRKEEKYAGLRTRRKKKEGGTMLNFPQKIPYPGKEDGMRSTGDLSLVKRKVSGQRGTVKSKGTESKIQAQDNWAFPIDIAYGNFIVRKL